MKKIFIALLLLLCACTPQTVKEYRWTTPTKNSSNAKTNVTKDGVYAKIATTKGQIIVKLEFEKTPLTVANFVGLAEGTKNNEIRKKGEPYYDGLFFHRVIDNFMVQTGCPKGDGTGNPGYRFRDELHSSLKHSRPGTLSMANSGPRTNGSQFFITHRATPWLDNKHTVFGFVIEGQTVVNKIRRGDRIESIKILRIGKKAKAFKGNEEHFQNLQNAKTVENTEGKEPRVIKKERLSDRERTLQYIKSNFSDYKTKQGIRYKITKQGKGGKAQIGNMVSFFYRGRILGRQGVFVNNFKGRPVSVNLGAGQLIEGMESTLLDMEVGEKRSVLIPPYLGFGSRADSSGKIPGNSYLLFDIELKRTQ